MGRETVLFKSEEKKTRNEAAELLRLIADKVEQGQITLGQNNNQVTLDFPGNLVVEVKAEEEEKVKVKRSLEIELEWVLGEEGQSGLTIG